MDGHVCKGRFRIRDVPSSESNLRSVTSVTSIRSAPPVVGEMPKPGANVWGRAGAAFGPGGGCEASLDQSSDLSDYSFFAVASEVSENGSTGRLVEGGRENGTGRRRARDNSVVAEETSETSAGCASEIGRRVLVSLTVACAAMQDRHLFSCGEPRTAEGFIPSSCDWCLCECAREKCTLWNGKP